MTRMFNPPRPDLTLRDDVLPALGLGVTQAAEQSPIVCRTRPKAVARVPCSVATHGWPFHS